MWFFVLIAGGESCSAGNDRARLGSSSFSGTFAACFQAADIFQVLRPSGGALDFDQIFAADDKNFFPAIGSFLPILPGFSE